MHKWFLSRVQTGLVDSWPDVQLFLAKVLASRVTCSRGSFGCFQARFICAAKIKLHTRWVILSLSREWLVKRREKYSGVCDLYQSYQRFCIYSRLALCGDRKVLFLGWEFLTSSHFLWSIGTMWARICKQREGIVRRKQAFWDGRRHSSIKVRGSQRTFF